MSGTFSIAAVTAVLKDLLNNGLADHDLSSVGNVVVTALPPDRIPATNADEKSQLNLFLYQATPNQGWRNVDLPSRSGSGERLSNPPLALDLRYLITAYGEKEFHSEALLGYAMQLLHENPVLTRAMIRATLNPTLPAEVTLPPGLAMLNTSGLAEQVEGIRITPHFLNAEEMSRLWSAMQAKYRPTAVYQVTVVLIQSDKQTKSALPVLKRGEQDRGPQALADLTPPFPALTEIVLPNNQEQALPGDLVQVLGHDLAGDTGKPGDVDVTVHFSNSRTADAIDIAIPAADRSAAMLRFTLPVAPDAMPAGLYSMSALVAPSGKPDQARTSNERAFWLAPRVTSVWAPVARAAVDPVTHLGTATVVLTCVPDVLPEQRVSLVLGSRESAAQLHTVTTNSLSFVFKDMPAGEYRVRLRVDGAESVLVDRTDPADLKFDESQKQILT